jgi:hypothetical protein
MFNFQLFSAFGRTAFQIHHAASFHWPATLPATLCVVATSRSSTQHWPAKGNCETLARTQDDEQTLDGTLTVPCIWI